ncbi:MAG: Asp-tRNA(Asn)/Glu-tRNA(Gln) amidotransferase subunit GatC [Deltaproteobacteria bacterium]|jgi:aspartyl-tRNA(Asn)/glutamyl-tRNA(Gln) amidotransferase subunit C|nr:Asp-tRNA(Asn)/Glu-tRNA(Gln) amidotransferase subunit GatC [Deltaproteobacteria bacterium]MBT6431484.1 Asp-tRNA(Asn)/Glu-tRNA(Gln) amidotransferase subunit GatC [Deltaproteobacteria bacterium]MBT6490462.1 Asp-tRNA(Asn)/Glu-tRNA(Gln) amidotransferase subunit GatC [Deltaproteobacteria bacterium]|tara:strand:- start:95 stop:391 length:297 start_codon:yes stop_codon:yes gene_type:complete
MTKQRIDAEEVMRIATLARLELEENEVEMLTRDLASILSYVDKLDELDTEGVEATTHAVELSTTLREDKLQPGLDVELGLRQAPERLGDGFGVPKIIE